MTVLNRGAVNRLFHRTRSSGVRATTDHDKQNDVPPVGARR